MPADDCRVFADDVGVWQQSESGEPFGIRWEEICEVTGYLIDGVTEVNTMVTLEFEYGEYVEIYDQQPGFMETVEAITARLPGIDRNWLSRVRASGLNDPAVSVWKRVEPS